MDNLQTPLILVFYIDVEMMKTREVIQPFIESVNEMIERKNANVMAFFIPTADNERIECVNPVMLQEPELEKINQMIAEIKETFQIDSELVKNNDEEVTTTKEE